MPRTPGAVTNKKKSILDQIGRTKVRGKINYWHPVVALADVARTGMFDGEPVDQATRIDCMKEVAKYVAPKLKPLDLEKATEKSTQFQVKWESVIPPNLNNSSSKVIEHKPIKEPKKVRIRLNDKGVNTAPSMKVGQHHKRIRRFHHIEGVAAVPVPADIDAAPAKHTDKSADATPTD